MKNLEKRPRVEEGTQEESIETEEGAESSASQLEKIREYFKKRLLEEGSLRARGEEESMEEIRDIRSSLQKLDKGSPEDLENILNSFSNHGEFLKDSIKGREKGLEGIGEDKRQEGLEDIKETEGLIDEKRYLEANLLEVLKKREPTKEIVHEDVVNFLQDPEEFDQEYKEEGEEETEISKLNSKLENDFRHDGVEGIEEVLAAVNKRVEGINEGEDGGISKQALRREHLRDLRDYLAEEFSSNMSKLSEQREQEELQKIREEAKEIFEEKSERENKKEV